MTQANFPHDAVIACIDGSEYTQKVLDAAIWAATKLDAPIGLLHAHDKTKQSTPHDYSGSIGLGSREHLLDELTKVDAQHARLIKEHGQALLKEAKTYVQAKTSQDVVKLHRHETLKESLYQLPEDTKLIILGQMGGDEHSDEEHVGSQLETAIRTSRCPVLVVTENFGAPKAALYAFDNRKNSIQGLKWLAKNKLFFDARVHVVMAGEDNDANCEALRRAAAKLKQAGMEVTKSLVAGKPKEALMAYQKEHELDILAIGAYGHSRIHEFFVGSTTQKLISDNQNAILTLRF